MNWKEKNGKKFLNRSEISNFIFFRNGYPDIEGFYSFAQHIGLLGHTIPLTVTAARWLSALGTMLCLPATAALAVVAFLSLGQDEATKIRTRYGSMLISIAQANLTEETQRMEVASVQDLARLAQRDGRTIFHQKLAPGYRSIMTNTADSPLMEVFRNFAAGGQGEPSGTERASKPVSPSSNDSQIVS